MNIVILGNFQYPFGSASASRIRHFAKGLSFQNNKVDVISLNRVEDRTQDIIGDSRIHDDIVYESALGYGWEHVKKRRTIIDKFQWFKGFKQAICNTIMVLNEKHKNNKIDVIIQYNRSAIAIQPVVQWCRENEVVLLQDVVEWPDRTFYFGGFLHPNYWDVKKGMNTFIPQSDGIIGISSFLCDIYKKKGLPVINIPAVIEIPDSIPEHVACGREEFNLMYLGHLRPTENPMIMIKAVKMALDNGLPLKFHIVGTNGQERKEAIEVHEYCKSHKLLGRNVFFYGRVSDEEVKNRICSSDALIFVRKDCSAAKAAFPTRIPEYLVSGIPVIASAVTDIPYYLKDGKDAMLISECSPEGIFRKIKQLIELPDRGISIGRSGFNAARKHFDYLTRAKQINDFALRLLGQN